MNDNSNATASMDAIASLLDSGVDVCFTNPGTSEMHMVQAIDRTDGMRAILGLFEGVVTGAADGYGRMAGKAAATLLHLGPGFANGGANLHNARRAGSPVLNIIGDHATYHHGFDAPLESDIAGIAGPVSDWVGQVEADQDFATCAMIALSKTQAATGKVASLIVPADRAWCPGKGKARLPEREAIPTAREDQLAAAHTALTSGEKAVLLLSPTCLDEETLDIAGRIAGATGCILASPTFAGRRQRGRGRVRAERLPYFGDLVLGRLRDVKHLVLAGSRAPVSFFAYEGMPSRLVPEGCALVDLADETQNARAAIHALAESLGCMQAEVAGRVNGTLPPMPQDGKLDGLAIGAALANLMPEGAIISDESNTNGIAMRELTVNAAPHDWLDLTGGSIGQGLPVATGAAVACPDRKVIALQSDGSAMYTIQALWTMARENLDVTTIILSNKSYAILNVEYARLGLATDKGDKAVNMMSLDNPAIDFASLARGMGVDAISTDNTAEFVAALKSAMSRKGPFLIDARIELFMAF